MGERKVVLDEQQFIIGFRASDNRTSRLFQKLTDPNIVCFRTDLQKVGVAPVFHSRLPAAVVDKVDDPQLFTAVTTGVGGIVLGAAMPLPAELVHPFTVVVTV